MYAVRCVNQHTLDRDHLFKPVPNYLLPEINFLIEQFQENQLIEENDSCGIILQQNVRRRTCGKLYLYISNMLLIY